MSGNTFGKAFCVTTFGESHGGAVGVIVDGARPGVDISEAAIQYQLDRRKPGQGGVTTSRKETDEVSILSGIFEGKTLGTPIAMLLHNKDSAPSAYDNVKDLFRPGHADFSYECKYGLRDWRGGGRSSGRETAARVAAGAIARQCLEARGISITAYTQAAAGIRCTEFKPEQIEKNPMRACDPEAAELMIGKIRRLQKQHDSAGGVVECIIHNAPAGLGEPVFDKLDAQLAAAVFSIGAVKGVEFGAGFKAADMTGSENNDEMEDIGFLTNNAGGILGGISTGAEIVLRAAIKPTPSIAKTQKTINKDGENVEVKTEGRHDACICPRIVPVIEAMVCIVLEDHIKRYAALKT